MTNVLKAAGENPLSCTIEQLELENVPATAVHIDLLKAFEGQLVRQEYLKVPLALSGGYAPLWFLAETERNILLWRHGLSISDAPSFEFWVEVPRLIQKRREKLSTYDVNNPFNSDGWKEEVDEGIHGEELRYLTDMEQVLQVALTHCHALSHAARLALDDGQGEPAPVVLLPIHPKVSSAPDGPYGDRHK